MRWYMAYFVIHCEVEEASAHEYRAREELCLLTAEDSALAYAKSLEIAKRAATEEKISGASAWTVDGITDLLMLIEEPGPGSELAWTEEELSPDELRLRLKSKADLSVFRNDGSSDNPPGSEWYMGTVVLTEIHDTGSHGESLLVWTNSHLVNAKTADSAFEVCTDIGRTIESKAGSHKCDGDSAHWQFMGLGDLFQTLAPPSDGAILWFREFTAGADELRKLIPPWVELGIFKWERSRSEGFHRGQTCI